MRYEQQILEAYDRIGFKPRDRQVEHINKVVVSFLDEGYTNVILSAPTGTGKSIIGAVVADVIHQIKFPNVRNGASFMLTATNVLAQQYHDTFGDPDNPWEGTFLQIKGAANYMCGALDTPEEPAKADSCSIIAFQKSGMQDMIDKYCEKCEYKLSRAMREKSRHLITNYAYYFINRMYATHPMEKRSVCVFDEAHLLNDLFVEHNAIYFSEKRLEKLAEEISENLGLGKSDVFYGLKKIKDDMVMGRINDQNYQQHLQKLLDIYKSVSDSFKQAADRNMRQPSKYLKLQKLSKKFYDLGCKIDDLFVFGYPAVFEYKLKDFKKGQNEHEISVKPIFIGEMFEALHNAHHNLLMSATISESYTKRTMSLPGTTKHIRLEPQFPPENKKVIFFKPQALNYNTMKDPEVIKKLCATTYQIVKHHTEKGERGIILAPSFVVAQSITGSLQGAKIKGLKIFEHIRGEKLAEVLFDFKQHNGSAVLVTPSGFEGIDLPGDLSRYQVIVKAPFASLGDKRVEHILNVYPDIYSAIALMKIVQGAGRSVRSKEDHAHTYMLDTAIQRLWTKGNEWSDEFQTRFTSNLSDDEHS